MDQIGRVVAAWLRRKTRNVNGRVTICTEFSAIFHFTPPRTPYGVLYGLRIAKDLMMRQGREKRENLEEPSLSN